MSIFVIHIIFWNNNGNINEVAHKRSIILLLARYWLSCTTDIFNGQRWIYCAKNALRSSGNLFYLSSKHTFGICIEKFYCIIHKSCIKTHQNRSAVLESPDRMCTHWERCKLHCDIFCSRVRIWHRHWNCPGSLALHSPRSMSVRFCVLFLSVVKNFYYKFSML